MLGNFISYRNFDSIALIIAYSSVGVENYCKWKLPRML